MYTKSLNSLTTFWWKKFSHKNLAFFFPMKHGERRQEILTSSTKFLLLPWISYFFHEFLRCKNFFPRISYIFHKVQMNLEINFIGTGTSPTTILRRHHLQYWVDGVCTKCLEFQLEIDISALIFQLIFEKNRFTFQTGVLLDRNIKNETFSVIFFQKNFWFFFLNNFS